MSRIKPEEKIRVRLKREHFLNGLRKAAGSVIRLPKSSAVWLQEQGRAKLIDQNR
jgi:hypothetical protein